jgi:probable addiction module antidote protein
MAKTKVTKFDIAEYLDSEEAIAAYLSAELAEGDPKYIKIALSNIARARNMSALAKRAGLSRAVLYRALEPDSRAEYETIQKIMNALDVQLVAKPSNQSRRLAA